jgi:hypothetical protein
MGQVHVKLVGRRLTLLFVSSLAFLAALSSTRPASAQIQVSDQFKQVANTLAKRFVAEELTHACDKSDGTTDPICTAVVASLSEVFNAAIDGKLDDGTIALALRKQFSLVAQASAAELARRYVGTLMLTPAPASGCSATGIAEPIVQCIVARAYKTKTAKTDCQPALNALAKVVTSCGGAPPAPTADLNTWIHAAADALRSSKDSYAAVMILTQLAQLADRGPTSMYDIVHAAALRDEDLLMDVADPTRDALFYDNVVDAIRDSDKAGECSGGAAAKARAEAWKQARQPTFRAIADAVAGMRPLPPEMAKLPDDVPDPRCTDPAAPLTTAVSKLRRFARVFRTDVTVGSTVQQVLLPAMLVAILVDYIAQQDDAQLQHDLADFALEALARAIAAHDADDIGCAADPLKHTLTCTPMGGGKSVGVYVPQGVTTRPQFDDYALAVEERHYPVAARRTCLYQAASALLTGSFPTVTVAPRVCRQIDGSLAGTVFEPHLVSKDGGLAEWDDQFSSGVTIDYASLRLTGTLTAQGGFDLVTARLSALVHDLHIGELDSVVELLQAYRSGFASAGQRAFLLRAADVLRPHLQAFLDAHVAPLTWCQEGNHANGIACAERVLTEAAYEPVMGYVAAPGRADADAHALAQKLYTELDKLDPLGSTPLLFNIGPGATGIAQLGKDSKGNLTVLSSSGHLTLLDKFGLAYRFGDRNQWEVGGFAGGFLDAIIRAAAQGSNAVQYWIVGGTFGFRKISTDWPLGLEAYVGEAIPFDLTQFGNAVGTAGGVNIIVPADAAFGSGR